MKKEHALILSFLLLCAGVGFAAKPVESVPVLTQQQFATLHMLVRKAFEKMPDVYRNLDRNSEAVTLGRSLRVYGNKGRDYLGKRPRIDIKTHTTRSHETCAAQDCRKFSFVVIRETERVRQNGRLKQFGTAMFVLDKKTGHLIQGKIKLTRGDKQHPIYVKAPEVAANGKLKALVRSKIAVILNDLTTKSKNLAKRRLFH